MTDRYSFIYEKHEVREPLDAEKLCYSEFDLPIYELLVEFHNKYAATLKDIEDYEVHFYCPMRGQNQPILALSVLFWIAFEEQIYLDDDFIDRAVELYPRDLLYYLEQYEEIRPKMKETAS